MDASSEGRSLQSREEDEVDSVTVNQEEAEEEEQVDYGSGGEDSIYSDDRPVKRLRCHVDRISALPDSVIGHILALMPVRDAFKTCVLSKRWRDTWASTSTLIYIFKGGSRRQFSEFVDKTLILHKSSKIDKFVLKSYYRSIKESSLCQWVHAAVIKQVEELSIESVYTDDRYTILPQILYSCESLKKLSLTQCSVGPICSPVCWSSLKHLSLTSIELEGDLIQKFLDGSPLLESLQLKDCTRFGQIRIYSERLKSLVIYNYTEPSGALQRALELDAPFLVTLEILGVVDRNKCKLKNVNSLVRASLTFSIRHWTRYYFDDDDQSQFLYDQLVVRDLLEKVRDVPNLTVGSWIIQVLSTCEVKHLLPSFFIVSMQRCLVLEINLHQFDLPGIASMLQTSPLLERLVIDVSPRYYIYDQVYKSEELENLDGEKCWTSKDWVPPSLKTVEIVGFSELVIDFARFLLQGAKDLERMTFITRSKMENDDDGRCYFGRGNFFKTVNKLLSLPRASSRAQIMLM